MSSVKSNKGKGDKKTKKTRKSREIKVGGPLTPGKALRPTVKGPKGANLFLMNVPLEMTVKQMERLFKLSKFNPISISIPGKRYRGKRVDSTVAFVSFSTAEEAKRVLKRFEYGFELSGKRVFVVPAREK
jgi:RNA recognition motif-containing protein